MTEKTAPKPIFRFAPSPNGALHMGHAYSALLNEALAKRTGGAFLLRMEDIDTTRCTPELEQAIYDDLNWLSISWQEPVMRQSERFEIYKKALDRFYERGLIYPAFLSRREIKKYAWEYPDWPRDPDGTPHYPGDEKLWDKKTQQEAISEGKSFAWRLDMKKALLEHPVKGAESWGDVVLARKEIPTSYHLAVVLDDAAQNITHVVRGLDLEVSTAVHRLLQKLLDLTTPHYLHHRLIKDDVGEKLSKSNRSTGLKALRDQGTSAEDIRELIDWSEDEVEDLATQLT